MNRDLSGSQVSDGRQNTANRQIFGEKKRWFVGGSIAHLYGICCVHQIVDVGILTKAIFRAKRVVGESDDLVRMQSCAFCPTR